MMPWPYPPLWITLGGSLHSSTFAGPFRRVASPTLDALREHTIPFSGLKDGQHVFDLVLDDAFFRATGVEDFEGGKAKATITMDKSEHLLVCNIRVDGYVAMPCDHCNAPMQQPVHGDQRQIFKLMEITGVEDDELVELGPQATEINFTHYLFECITLHLPIRHVHPDGQCDPEVEKAFEKIRIEHEPAPDPRWEVLKKLKSKR